MGKHCRILRDLRNQGVRSTGHLAMSDIASAVMVQEMFHGTGESEVWERLITSLGLKAKKEVVVLPGKGSHEDRQLVGFEISRSVFFLFTQGCQL